MTRATARLLLWMPRVLGTAVALFLALFALDAVDDGVFAVLIHLLPPTIVLLLVAVSWRREWIGAGAFVLLAVIYAATIAPQAGAMLLISGPLLLVALSFLLSWQYRDALHRVS